LKCVASQRRISDIVRQRISCHRTRNREGPTAWSVVWGKAHLLTYLQLLTVWTQIVKKEQVKQVLREKKVLQAASFPFIASLSYTFKVLSISLLG